MEFRCPVSGTSQAVRCRKPDSQRPSVVSADIALTAAFICAATLSSCSLVSSADFGETLCYDRLLTFLPGRVWSVFEPGVQKIEQPGSDQKQDRGCDNEANVSAAQKS